MTNSIDQKEIQHFSKDSAHWWDENGPFRPLHRLNPVRLRYIKDVVCAHYGADPQSLKPFEKLSFLDIGCGGGLVCEPLARLGGNVSGVDADAQAIQAAQDHAGSAGLNIHYIAGAAEHITKQYDVVLALEIIEHVSDPAAFVKSIAKLVKPGGIVIFSTLNRNPKSFMLGIVAAEYVLRWVPKGTHHWQKFLKPSELAGLARSGGFEPLNVTGLIFNPLLNEFALSQTDLDVNYLMSAVKKA